MLFDLIDHRPAEAFLGYPAATQVEFLNLIAACVPSTRTLFFSGANAPVLRPWNHLPGQDCPYSIFIL
jgi:hypothetical protein